MHTGGRRGADHQRAVSIAQFVGRVGPGALMISPFAETQRPAHATAHWQFSRHPWTAPITPCSRLISGRQHSSLSAFEMSAHVESTWRLVSSHGASVERRARCATGHRSREAARTGPLATEGESVK